MALKVFDTLRDERIDFHPVHAGKAGLYVCGMTVQDKPHVGHMRASIVGDLVRRSLVWLGYDVTFLNNFTDVDDKIIARANEEGLDYTTIAQRNADAYLQYVDLVGNARATHYPRATEHIPEIHALIGELIQKGAAYAAAGDVYFRVDRFAGYGKLSKRKIDDLRSGARIEVGEHKENPLDFALWKGAKENEPHWSSPWGPGRPGWHIECSAMAMKYLGPSFDFHGGGLDLIFPHHENEIAQSEAATGQTFVNFWVHNGLVLLGGEKMSKSTKHFFLIEDICKVTDPMTVRFYLLSTHYRSPIEFSEERLAEAGVAFARLQATSASLREAIGAAPASVHEPLRADQIANGEFRASFEEFGAAIQDDFNSARAQGQLFDLSRALNRMLAEPSSGEKESRLREGQRVFEHLVGFLGLKLDQGEAEVPADIARLAAERNEARRSKEWAKADEIRGQIAERGYILEDRDGKTVVKPAR